MKIMMIMVPSLRASILISSSDDTNCSAMCSNDGHNDNEDYDN